MKTADNVYIVGSGIASLAAASYLIRYEIVPPGSVKIFESGKDFGGAMGASMVDVPFSPDYPRRPKR
ncbi:MAG TPA: oleate hydratase, partial [Xanthobacteraceae bacterium]|nr:oleate hydratase [Xanthobacteraceae bacterium]